MARPPWLPPPEKERRWSLSGLGSKKKDQREPGRDREAAQVVDLDEDDDRVVEASAAAVPETTTVENVEADGVITPADVDGPVSQPRRTATDDSAVVPSVSEPVVPEQVDTPWEMKVPAWGEVSEPAVSSSALDRVDNTEVPGIGEDSAVVPSVSEPVVPEQVDTPWEMKVPAWGEVSEPAVSSSALDRVDDIEVPGTGDDVVEDRPGAAEVDSAQTGDTIAVTEPEFVVPEPVSERVDTPWEPEVPEIFSALEAAPAPVEDVVAAWHPPAPLVESESVEPEPVAAESKSSADNPELDEPVSPPVHAQTDDAVVAPEPVSERVDTPWEPEVPEIFSALEAAPAPVEDVVAAWHPPAPLVESESIEPEPVAGESERVAPADVDEPVSPPVHALTDDAIAVTGPELVVPEPVSERVDTPWEPVVPEISSAVEAAPAPVEDVVAAWHPPAPLAESESIEPEPVAAESVSSADAPELDEVEMRAAALLEAVARARESAADSVAEPATEADGLSQLDEPPTQAADSDVPEAEPSGDVPAVDEIDQRAAALLAAMEAKRSQSAASESDSTEQAPAPASEPERDDEPAPDLSFDHPTELDEVHDLPSPPDFDSGEVETDEPSEVDANSATGSDAVAQGLSEHHETAQGYPEHIDEDSPDADAEDVQSQRPPTRRLALPPWQLPGAATSVEFERFGPHKPSSFDDDGPFSRLRREHADKAAPSKPPAEPLGESPEAVVRDAPQPPMQDPRLPPPPPPPGWRPPQPPPPGWRPPQPPPPGWRPPQPPPPGWRPPQPPPPPPGWVAHQPSPDAGHPGPPGPPPQEHRAAPPANYRPPQAFRVPTPLEEAELTGQHPNAPQSGWRRRVRMATGGHVNPGLSRRDRLRQELEEQIRQPIVGDFRIAVLSIKGGVGKTTTTLGLGSALAMVRHDRVIAVDANPDRGTLAERVRDESTQSTVRDLLSDPNLHSYADVRNHTLMATSRLEILASEQEPAVSEVFSEGDYRRTVEILRHYYNIILTDCGTGIMHSAMAGVLDLAHTIVLVSAPAMDAARSASATLDWLMQHGYSGLVRGAHVVLSTSRPGSANLKIDKLYEHFESRCRSVHTIPFDPHLSEGADIDFGLLRQQTMDAYLDLAASVSEDFGRLRGPAERP
ncbi:AAA family ATPase [Mycobacteroides salmoniphilum]|uniref:nucleotide-binding protein n=1 Tax=Mycobacteroides salmoniphilum TaxID=404941 RepID=UPI000993CCC3